MFEMRNAFRRYFNIERFTVRKIRNTNVSMLSICNLSLYFCVWGGITEPGHDLASFFKVQ